jgi:hypothetical protein
MSDCCFASRNLPSSRKEHPGLVFDLVGLFLLLMAATSQSREFGDGMVRSHVQFLEGIAAREYERRVAQENALYL